VYAVMVETGLNRHDLGKLILAACFITDLGTVLALGGLFATYGWLLVVFVAVSAVTLLVLPRLLRLAITHFGHRVSEPEIKLLLVVLFALGGLATQAGSEAVLPAYVAGLVVAGVFLHDRVLMDRLRSIAFALLTPFFFLRAGTLISAPALVSGAGVIAVLLLVKLVAKAVGVWPVATAFKLPRQQRTYTTLLMATGLTFGSIAALFGLTHNLIDKAQYTELVTVVILSAFVPTLIAQQLFQPAVVDTEEEEALGGEDVSIIRHGNRPSPHRGSSGPGVLPGSGGWAVAVQDLGVVGVPGGGGAVRVEGECPAPAVDGDLVVEEAQQDAVADAGGSAVGLVPDVVDLAGGGGLGAAAGPPAVRIAQGDGVADGGGDGVAVADVQGQARPGQAGAELLAAQERREPAGAGQQLDGLADDGPLQRLPGQRPRPGGRGGRPAARVARVRVLGVRVAGVRVVPPGQLHAEPDQPVQRAGVHIAHDHWAD
jgi:hypothetical protein